MANSGRRKRDDEALAMALAAGKTLRQAAAAAGVAERTASRRLAEESFVARVAELRAEMTDRAMGKLSKGMAAAGDVLMKLLKSKSESIRLGACRAMLDMGTKLRQAVELQAKVDELEQTLEAVLKGQGAKP